MPSIRIEREHSLGLARAKKAVDKVAKGIQDKFEVEASWNKNTLCFERAGVDGEISVSANHVSVHANISFLLLPIKSAIEQEIHKYLDHEFGD